VYDSYVALGDSFTEGLDDRLPDGTFRGWADLVAAALAARTPGFRYANLAVRGRRLAQVVQGQLGPAERLRPALVSVSVGGNDIIGLRCDVPALAQSLHEMLERLVATGATVLVFTGFDARGRVPMGRAIAARAAQYNVAIAESARRLDLLVVDLWALPGLYSDRMWARDRLHLSSEGHALVAEAVLAATAAATALEDDPRRWVLDRLADADWAYRYLLPWVWRKLRGRSAGDLVEAKRPELVPLLERAGQR